jgi:hypothetical protein
MTHPARAAVLAAACLLAIAAACDRRPAATTGTAAATGTATATGTEMGTSTESCTLAPVPLRLPAPKRLVAIGDLHGDLSAMRAALRAADAIDGKDHWIGGALVVVQTGDILDRGDDERAMLDLFARLEREARAAGGAIVVLLGNHELMNGAGDFRYVTPSGLRAFDDVPRGAAALATSLAGSSRGRFAALGAGGAYAHWLARHAVVAIVGDTIFSHAGVLGAWSPRLDDVNQSSRCWLDGQSPQRPAALAASDSPVWTRALAAASVDCAAVHDSLSALGAKRMVVGHSVQEQGITSACDGTVWRIDVGLAKHYGGPIEVLELIQDSPPKVLRGTR